MKFLIIDNYDSFVYNLAQRLGELGITSNVIRNDQLTICLLYTSPSPRDVEECRMPSSA